MSSKKGQVSTEFIFSLGIVIVIFLMLIYLSFEKTKEVRDTESMLDKKAECIRMANMISGVFSLGPGTEKLSHTDYRIYARNNTVLEVQRDGHTQKEPPVQCRFSANIYERNFTGGFRVSNVDSIITISST
ncbi:MAG: hypothetical protein V1906_02470 [Candidatus Woesearchaeota archaeon]